jgi:hypothetical protein
VLALAGVVDTLPWSILRRACEAWRGDVAMIGAFGLLSMRRVNTLRAFVSWSGAATLRVASCDLGALLVGNRDLRWLRGVLPLLDLVDPDASQKGALCVAFCLGWGEAVTELVSAGASASGSDEDWRRAFRSVFWVIPPENGRPRFSAAQADALYVAYPGAFTEQAIDEVWAQEEVRPVQRAGLSVLVSHLNVSEQVLCGDAWGEVCGAMEDHVCLENLRWLAAHGFLPHFPLEVLRHLLVAEVAWLRSKGRARGALERWMGGEAWGLFRPMTARDEVVTRLVDALPDLIVLDGLSAADCSQQRCKGRTVCGPFCGGRGRALTASTT